MCDKTSMKELIYSPVALKALRKMQPKRAAAIAAKLEAFAKGERVDLVRVEGTDYHRIRIGQDRAIIKIADQAVRVIEIGPRGGIYK